MKQAAATIMAGVSIWLAACVSSPSQAFKPSNLPRPEPKPLTAVEKARQELSELNASETAMTAKLLEQRNQLLSLPQDSPSTREITRRLAILNKGAQDLATKVFGAQLALDQAIKADNEAQQQAAIDAAIKAAAALTKPPTLGADITGMLNLTSFRLMVDPAAGTRFLSGEISNSGTNVAGNVTVVFDMYDAAGDSVGTVSDYVNRIELGAAWSFKALVPDNNAVRAEFKELKSETTPKLPSLPGTQPAPVTPPTTPPVTPPSTPPVP